MPLILIGFKYRTLIAANTLLPYLSFVALGALSGFAIFNKTPIKNFKKSNSIEIPGSYSTLIILLLFFAVKYTFGYLQATDPITAADYAIIDLGLSGILSGYTLGRAINFTYRFYTTKS